MFQSILPDALVQAGGWTILHSLWQGAIITLLLAFVLGQTRQSTPAFRYQLSVGALLLLLGSVVFTFFQYYEPVVATARAYTGGGELLTAFELKTVAPSSSLQDRLSTIFPVLLQVWLIGVAFMGLRMMGELAYLQRLRFSNTREVDDNWIGRLDALSRKMGISRYIAMKESLRIGSPMLVGFFKPVILLPVGMLTGLSPQQVECVLAHELAHVRRMDYLVNLLQSVVEVLLFFNPAVWWISAQIREEREHCCDELAIDVTGDRVILVKTLAQLEEWRLQGGHLGLAFNGRPQGILGRVQRLLGGESSVRIIGKGLWSLLLFCMAMGLLAFREQPEGITPERHWENVGLIDEEAVQEEQTNLQPATVSLTETAITTPAVRPQPAQRAYQADAAAWRPAESQVAQQIRSWQIRQLPTKKFFSLASIRDTVPDEKLDKAMKELQQQMEILQQELMNSAEMKQIKELTQSYEKDMRAYQEKMMAEQGGYEKIMKEHEKVREEMEKRHRELMESGAFKSMQEEMQKLSEVYSRQAEEIARQYREQPSLMDEKMDSLSRIFEKQHEAFEKENHAAFQALEKEMEALENNPEFQAMEEQMEAMNEKVEKLMEEQMQPMEEQMEKLQEQLEMKFEGKMRSLHEQMEKLEMQRHKREHNPREE